MQYSFRGTTRILSFLALTVALVHGCGVQGCGDPLRPALRTAMVPMRDGVALATDVHFPPGRAGRHPVLLLRTPYDRTLLRGYADDYTSHGYVVAIQDVRGRFASGGDWEPFIHESRDGYDTVEWLAAQPWSTGAIGMIGGSYSGSAQYAAAVSSPPHLRAIVPSVTPAVPFDNLPYDNGAFLLGWAVRWTDLVENAHTGPQLAAKLRAAVEEDWWSRLDHLPVIEIDRMVIGHEVHYWRRWIEHDRQDAYWAPATYLDRLPEVDVPVFVQSGWFDPGTRGARLAYERLAQRNGPDLRLMVGPWGHSERGGRILDGTDLGPAADVDLPARYRRWLDRFLKADGDGPEDGARVELYLMGSNRWLTGDTYPLPGTRFTAFYLTAPGPATGPPVDGGLAESPPSDDAGFTTYSYDPSDPTPSFHAYLKRGELAVYRNRVETRDDVLVYETAPRDEPLHLAGPVRATIYASTSARDTDWTATLYAIDGDGQPYPLGLTFGIVRARFRRSREAPELLEPGLVHGYDIDMGHTAITVPAGHRLRLEVASAAFPEFSRNLNTGGHNETETRAVVAHQQIHRGGDRPSHVLLPVIDSGG